MTNKRKRLLLVGGGHAHLMASLRGTNLITFKPQKRYLLIFNMGDDTGIFVRGGLMWRGKLSFTIKNRIDKGFMSQFQAS